MVERLNAALQGRYAIERRLGEGGMATVWLARDVRHHRSVALKILKPELAAIVGAERFLAEIRTTAGLQHPRILPLHDSGEADGLLFFVTPYVAGESLRARLEREKQLPVDDAVRIATEVADALDYAHRQGVIHRDVKPGNILLHEGRVLMADFGIALAVGTAGGDRLTETGLSLGTPHYMSPEQATGDRSLGAATDIYALGCVLYEMLIGEPPFTGSTPQAILGKIVTEELSSLSSQRRSVPTNVDYAVRRALQKVPADRFRTAAELGEALSDPSAGAGSALGVSAGAGGHPSARSGRIAVGAGALAALALGLWVGRATAPAPGRALPAEFIVSLEQEMGDIEESDVELQSMPLPDPTGRYLVFRGGTGGNRSLWIRPIESANSRPLAGTEGSTGPLVWSPDGEWIGFHLEGRLMRIRREGGPPEPIAELAGLQDLAWGAGGYIVFRPSPRSPLWAIHETGGPPRQVTELDTALAENSHRGVSFLPDGRRFLFTSRTAEPENTALYIGSVDAPGRRRLMSVEAQARYVAGAGNWTGALFYYSEGSLVARPFDPDAEVFLGEPTPVAEYVAFRPEIVRAEFEVSADGSLIILRPPEDDIARAAWFRRDGGVLETLDLPGRPFGVRVSPNGEGVLFSSPNRRNGNRDVWHYELARGIPTNLTATPENEWFPVWSPDARQMLFTSDRHRGPAVRVYLKRSLDPGADVVDLLPGIEGASPRDWSRDGEWILVEHEGDVLVASATDDLDPIPFLDSPFDEGDARFSPDGRWIAYVSDETGEVQVHVRPFERRPAGRTGRIQISVDGGAIPVWGPEGRELFFLAPDGVLYSVDTSGLGNGRPGAPRPLFRACPGGRLSRGDHSSYDTKDGERFLWLCLPRGDRYVVRLNWSWGE